MPRCPGAWCDKTPFRVYPDGRAEFGVAPVFLPLRLLPLFADSNFFLASIRLASSVILDSVG